MVKYWALVVSVLFSSTASAQVSEQYLWNYLSQCLIHRDAMVVEVCDLWDRPAFDASVTFAAHEQSRPGYHVRQEYLDDIAALQQMFAQIQSEFVDTVMTPKPHYPNELSIDEQGVLHRSHVDGQPDASFYSMTLDYFGDSVDYALVCLQEQENYSSAMSHLTRSTLSVVGILLYCEYLNEIQDDMQAAYAAILLLELADFMGFTSGGNGNAGGGSDPATDGEGGALPIFVLPPS